ncbi:MAG: hypothetical protein E7A62_01420 [Actinomycetaceae bacterium]|nr:hypothetical protein [Actinomycetaceae bacterium]MDU0969638.1 hypothetical protein [Actinomycetaceae bacterium]
MYPYAAIADYTHAEADSRTIFGIMSFAFALVGAMLTITGIVASSVAMTIAGGIVVAFAGVSLVCFQLVRTLEQNA